METILSINKVDSLNMNYEKDCAGYVIETTKQTIFVVAETERSYPTGFGCFLSSYNHISFVGCQIHGITLDNKTNIKVPGQLNPKHVCFDTDGGTLQITLYKTSELENEIPFYIKSKQLNVSGLI